MSATHLPTENEQSDMLRCTRCSAVLPRQAAFCSQCGERVKKQDTENSSLNYNDIIERYRITSLVRRRRYTQLFFAFDHQRQQAVAINAVNISSLAQAERATAIEAFQAHYDLLRQQAIPTIMRLIDLRYAQDHLYVVGSWPIQEKKVSEQAHQLVTLSSLLQSGIGLPTTQEAISWIYRLSRTLEALHRNNVIPGDLDPDCILFNEAHFAGDLALMVSWLPRAVAQLLPHPAIDTHTAYFAAPETLIGESEPQSDIYSLGAILYLLLSGVTPTGAAERVTQPLAPLREIKPRISSSIESVVMRALSLEKAERYQSADEFSDALLQLHKKSSHSRHSQKSSTPLARSIETTRPQEEIRVSSRTADNTSDEVANKPSAATTEDITVSIVPLQAQMARRYLSKRKTGKADIQVKQRGEEPVEEGLLEEEQYQERVRNADQGAPLAPPTEETSNPSIEEIPAEQTTEKTEADADAAQEAQTPVYGWDLKHIHSADLPTTTVNTQAATIDSETTKEIAIDQRDTIPFTYQVGSVLETHEHSEEQEEAGKHEEHEENGGSEHQTRAVIAAHSQALISGREPISERLKALFLKTTGTLPSIIRQGENSAVIRAITKQLTEAKDSTLLKQVQHFLIGEPQNSTKAAALIETPLRIQPGQGYSIRINIIGREKPKGPQAAGLSALVQGEKVHIEVRSALYQNYAYIVQQADIQLPGDGYVAEVTMPMQTLGGGPSGRRERLHIFFMDEANSPLYEKPFVIELFISHLVQSGREGHNVLSIPL